MSQSDDEHQDGAFNPDFHDDAAANSNFGEQGGPGAGQQSGEQPGYNYGPQGGANYGPQQGGFDPNQQGYNPAQPGYNPAQPGYNPAQPAYNPAAAAPLVGPVYRPLEPDIPARGTASPFSVMPKVVSRLFRRDTANAFAWAFAGKHFGWTVFGSLAVLMALLFGGAMYAISTETWYPEELPLMLGLFMLLSSIFQQLIFAWMLNSTLNSQAQRKVPFSDAVDIWGGTALIWGLFALVYVPIATFLLMEELRLAPWGRILLIVATVIFFGFNIWGYVVAYQGQRWYLHTAKRFVGKWVLAIIAAVFLTSVVYNLLNLVFGIDQMFNATV